MKKLWILIPLIVIAAVGWYFWQQQQQAEAFPLGIVSSNGRLELKQFDIASLYPGRVEQILVDEGEDVVANQLLVELSSTQSESQLMASQATEQRAYQMVSQAQAGRKQAEQSMARAQAEINAQLEQQKVAKMDLDNARMMRSEDLISDSEVSNRQAAYNGAAAAVQAARAAYAEAQAAAQQVDAQIAEAKAGVNEAKAQQQAASSMNDDMLIRSPKAGRVEYRIAEIGSVIAAGNKVISLLDTEDAFMNIFLPNQQMSSLQVGSEARIVLDGLDNVWPAEVSFIASEAQFTPKSVETQNEREKLMFKVRIKLPAEVAQRYKGLLKGGMTGNGYVRSDTNVAWPDDLAVKLPNTATSAQGDSNQS